MLNIIVTNNLKSTMSTIYSIVFFTMCRLKDGLLVPIWAPRRACSQNGKTATTLLSIPVQTNMSCKNAGPI